MVSRLNSEMIFWYQIILDRDVKKPQVITAFNKTEKMNSLYSP